MDIERSYGCEESLIPRNGMFQYGMLQYLTGESENVVIKA